MITMNYVFLSKLKSPLFLILFCLISQSLIYAPSAFAQNQKVEKQILNAFPHTDNISGGNIYIISQEKESLSSNTEYNIYQSDLLSPKGNSDEKLDLTKTIFFFVHSHNTIARHGEYYGITEGSLLLEKYSKNLDFKWDFNLKEKGFKRITGITTYPTSTYEYIAISGVNSNDNYVVALINSSGKDFKMSYLGVIPSMIEQNRSWLVEPAVIPSCSSKLIYLTGQIGSSKTENTLVVLYKFDGSNLISKGIEWLTPDFNSIEKIAADKHGNIIMAGSPNAKDQWNLWEDNTLLLTVFINTGDSYEASDILHQASGTMRIKSLSSLAAISREYLILTGEMQHGNSLVVINPDFINDVPSWKTILWND